MYRSGYGQCHIIEIILLLQFNFLLFSVYELPKLQQSVTTTIQYCNGQAFATISIHSKTHSNFLYCGSHSFMVFASTCNGNDVEYVRPSVRPSIHSSFCLLLYLSLRSPGFAYLSVIICIPTQRLNDIIDCMALSI